MEHLSQTFGRDLFGEPVVGKPTKKRSASRTSCYVAETSRQLQTTTDQNLEAVKIDRGQAAAATSNKPSAEFVPTIDPGMNFEPKITRVSLWKWTVGAASALAVVGTWLHVPELISDTAKQFIHETLKTNSEKKQPPTNPMSAQVGQKQSVEMPTRWPPTITLGDDKP